MHPFRHLDKMAAGDYVFVKYAEHTYVYETTETFVVSNKDRWIMDPVPSERYLLTLITCHPVGSARQRLILRARLIEIDGMTPQEFYAPEVPETPEGSDTPADAGASVDASAPPAPDTPADVGVSVDASAPPTPDTSPTPGAPDAGVSPDRDAPSPQVGATPGSGPPAEATESPPGAETPPPDGGVL
jgi:hypothetical protein